MQLPLIGKVQKQSLPWLVGLSAAGLVGVSGLSYLAVRQAAPRDNLAELTVPVQAQDVTVRITASGTVVPIQTVNLNPKTAGRLQELRVEQGDRVQKGQIIARMETKDLEAERAQALASLQQAEANLALLQAGTRPEQIGQAQAGVTQARAEVAAAQTRLDLATTRANRNRSLASEGAISRDRLDEVINEERSAQANLAQARARLNNTLQQLNQQENGPRIQEIQQAAAQVAAARGRLQAVENQLTDTIIYAPFAGIITQTGAKVGAFVTPTSFASSTSSATYVATLANGLEVLAKVPEVDISQIRLGQAVELHADAYPDQTFKGRVRLIAPEAIVEQNVTSFQVRVEILTGLDKLRSGMNTDLVFLGNRLNQAVMVPTVAIITDRGQTGVLVQDQDKKPRFQPVTIGASIGNQTQILEGVQPGQQVFVELPEGKKLQDILKRPDQGN